MSKHVGNVTKVSHLMRNSERKKQWKSTHFKVELRIKKKSPCTRVSSPTSATGWLCFLPVSCLSWGNLLLESTVSTVGLTSNLPKGLTPTRTSVDCCCQWPYPWRRLLPTEATSEPLLCRRPSNTHRQVWHSLLWGHHFFLACTRFCLCPARVSLCLSPVEVL